MEYRISTIENMTNYRTQMFCSKLGVKPEKDNNGDWYYPVYGWAFHREYRTEFTGYVGTSTSYYESSTVNFYLCGPVDQTYFVVDVDRNTGLPNLPIVAQATVNNPGEPDFDDEGYPIEGTASAPLNVGSAYGGTEIAANEVYILFAVRTGATTSSNPISVSFNTHTITDDSPPPEEWHVLHSPWYASVKTSGHSESNIYLPEYNLLCFKVDHESTNGSWTVEVSSGENARVYYGFSYAWSSGSGTPGGIYKGQGTNYTASDIPGTAEYIWIRFNNGASSGNVSVNISFFETQVETQWHAHVPTISMNSANALPASGFETWTDGLGEKEVLIYRFKLNEDFMPVFSYSGSQSLWMCISTVDNVNSTDGFPQPSNAIRGQGNGTNFSVTASEVLTADTWYYLFVETSTGDAYSGQIVITYQAGNVPETDWTYNTISAQTDILVQTTRDVTLTAKTGVMFQVTFRFSGRADFSVSGSGVNAYIYATSSNYGHSRESGAPYDYYGNELPDGTSTAIFVAAGSTSYVWVRGQTADTAGTVTVTITPPQAVWTEEDAGTKDITVRDEAFIQTFELNVQQVTAYRYELNFSKSGTVQIYSNGSTGTSDVKAYFSTVPRTFNTILGQPEDYDDLWEDAGPGDYNFNSGALTVTGGNTYYLWIRGATAETTAHIYIVVAGGGSSGGKKIWIYAGGQWIQATPYIYTGGRWVEVTPYVYTGGQWKECT